MAQKAEEPVHLLGITGNPEDQGCKLVQVFSRLEKTQSSSNLYKLFYTDLKPESGSSPTLTSTAKLFKYIYDNRFNPQYKYLPDELLPVSKTPFAWVLFDRFEPIKESAGK